MIGEIFNSGDNVDDQEDSWFIGSYLKNAPTNIDDCTKNKCLNIQRENLIPQRNIENNYKQADEIYQKQLIDEKESDERDQISKNDEEK